MTLRLRAAAYAPNGDRLGVLPTPESVQGSMVLGDVGAFSLAYPGAGPKSGWLSGPCEVALEVSWDGGQTWYEPEDGRYLRLRRKGDPTDRPNTVSYEGPGYIWVLSKSKVLPEGKLNADGKRPMLSATAGTILVTFLQEAQARGELPGLDVSTFTTTHDSSGEPWDKVITLYYEPGVDYLTVLRNLHLQGMVDFTMAGRSLRVYRGDQVMAGQSGATLRRGRDLTEAPYQGTLEGLTTDVFLMGDGGLTFERSNPGVVGPWGRWVEYISQGGVSDVGTMTVLTDTALEAGAQERVENTYGLDFSRAKALPFRDYSLGREVGVETAGQTPEQMRLRQITLERDSSGLVKGNVVLNDRFLENEVRQSRRIQGITGGSSLDGGSGARPTEPEDKTIPAAPAGLGSSSVAYLDDEGKVFAVVALDWAAVDTNTDGTAADDVAGYEAFWRLSSDTEWTSMGEVDGTAITRGGFQPGTSYDFTVRATDNAGHRSELAAPITDVTAQDATVPGQPSAPGVTPYLGQLLLAWDGLLATGGTPPTDFARAEVHLGAPGFDPVPGDPATLVDTITSPAGGSTVATGLTYGATYEARILLVDRAGNVSEPSDPTAGIPPKAAAGDIESLTANQITAGALSAAITVSGRIATALSGARVELNQQGLKQYNADGVLTVDVPSSGSGATFTGVFQTGFAGARAVMAAQSGQSEIQLHTGVVSETVPGRIVTTVAGTGSAANATLWLIAPTKNGLATASLQLRSRDTDTGSDVIFTYGNGSTYWISDASYGSHFYKTTGDAAGAYYFAIVRRNSGAWLASAGGVFLGHDSNGRGVDACMSAADTVKVIGKLDHSSGTLLMTDAYGQSRLYGAEDSISEFVRSTVLYNRTYTSAANIYITSTGTMGRSTSSARYKEGIDRAWSERADLDAIRSLRPTTYYDKGNAERYAQLVQAAPYLSPEDMEGIDAEYPRQQLGLIAEDVHALGLEQLVSYGDDGEPNGVAYERVAVALIPWLATLEERVASLESGA